MARWQIAALVLVVSVVALAGCAHRHPRRAAAPSAGAPAPAPTLSAPQQTPTISIRGALGYAGGAAAPPQSRAIVEVRDESGPEATVIAESRFDTAGRPPPIPFEMVVDRALLVPGRNYTLRGGIATAGRPTWVSDPVPINPEAMGIDFGTLPMKPVEQRPERSPAR